jgi:hypothetical protein
VELHFVRPQTHEPLHAQNNKTNSNIEFLWLYPIVRADALLEIGRAVISVVLSLNEHLSLHWDNLFKDFCDERTGIFSAL